MTNHFTITNDFHLSVARTVGGRLTKRQVQRIRAKLCGIDGCLCGGELSERGPQVSEISYDSGGRVIVGDSSDHLDTMDHLPAPEGWEI